MFLRKLLALVCTGLLIVSMAGTASAETDTISVYFMKMGDANYSAEKEIEDAINAYINPLIGANIDLNFVEQASYANQINNMISANQDVDLVCTVRQINSLYQNGGVLPLDDLIKEYGAGIVEALGESYLNSCKFDGEVYAIPTIRDLASNQIVVYDAEAAEKYGLEMKESMTLDELETELMKLHEQAPELVPIYMNSMVRTLAGWLEWDPMGDNFGVLFYNGDGTTVENLYESETYTNLVTRMHRWYENGLIYSEASTTTSTFLDLHNAGIGFAALANGQPGYDDNMTAALGKPMKTAQLLPPVATTTGIQTIAWVLPVTCDVPEKTMQLLDLLYTDPVVVNLLTYGIEGEHYVITDPEAGFIYYPEGVEFGTSTWNAFPTYMTGNETIGYIWQGSKADKWSTLSEFNRSATPSPALGFTFDNSSVTNQLTACNNVIAEYAVSLETGSVDPAVKLPEFQEALRKAGIEKIIAEKQEQFDAWKGQ